MDTPDRPRDATPAPLRLREGSWPKRTFEGGRSREGSAPTRFASLSHRPIPTETYRLRVGAVITRSLIVCIRHPIPIIALSFLAYVPTFIAELAIPLPDHRITPITFEWLLLTCVTRF